MNILTIFALQAAGAAAPAQGQAGASSLSFWVMMILIFAVMWFFMIRPQRKQQKELEQMRKELKKGDKVVTAGGIYGTIAEIQETTVLVKIDGEVKIRIDKNSVQKDPSEIAAAKAKEAAKKEEPAKKDENIK